MKIIRRLPVRIRGCSAAKSRHEHIVQLKAQIKPITQLPVKVRKNTFTRLNLPDGDFLITYYYCKDEQGHFVPEDIEAATHFERVVYTRDGYVIGSTIAQLNDKIHW